MNMSVWITHATSPDYGASSKSHGTVHTGTNKSTNLVPTMVLLVVDLVSCARDWAAHHQQKSAWCHWIQVHSTSFMTSRKSFFKRSKQDRAKGCLAWCLVGWNAMQQRGKAGKEERRLKRKKGQLIPWWGKGGGQKRERVCWRPCFVNGGACESQVTESESSHIHTAALDTCEDRGQVLAWTNSQFNIFIFA
jgi:hypothetical protein